MKRIFSMLGKQKRANWAHAFFALGVTAACLAVQAYAADAPGCKDSPLISRFPGSAIENCEDKADNAFTFNDIGPKKEPKRIEGEYHWTWYAFPQSASAAQVTRNLTTAFRTAGWAFVGDSGSGGFTVHLGKAWIREEVSAGGDYRQFIVIETELTQDVVASADALSSGLAKSGHIVVNGILFDTGKAEVKPESAPALQEVVKLLKQDGKLKVYVVGHTDNVGGLAANIELSRRRAGAIVQALTTQYGVAADRLQAYGDGPYAPLASNDSDDGRALNRRVELVKQ
jgi:outer membrane protein OmpA-like peptidoglycan-associated protein